MQRVILIPIAAVALALAVLPDARSADEKGTSTEGVREDFKRFAAAVRADKYDEAAKWIAPPADKGWAAYIALLPAAGKYDAALIEKFGKGTMPLFSDGITKKGYFADHFYEVRGDIVEIKAAGKNRAHVRVWTERPDWRKPKEKAIYERKFTAVKVGEVWKFHLHDIAGGTPVLKKVKRMKDGKEIEVYAEHSLKNVTDESTWVELDPIDHTGDATPPAAAVMLTKLLEILPGQTEKVLKGAYSTRKDAIKALEDAIDQALRPKK